MKRKQNEQRMPPLRPSEIMELLRSRCIGSTGWGIRGTEMLLEKASSPRLSDEKS